ncbi:MAG TPA: FecR domain-containing protein [Aequorivita sp.]|nr:FecR domain-containing protein [Aequorivita sp.]
MKNQQSSIFSDLISNNDFRDWVKGPNEERNYYWKKWMDANPDKLEEVKKAREFIERMAFKKEQLLQSELDEVLTNVIAGEKSPSFSVQHKNRKILSVNLRWLKAAAALFIFTIAAVAMKGLLEKFPYNQTDKRVVEWKTLKNPKGRKSKVILPDGSQVNLNYESELKFPVEFAGETRRVEMIGEAYFEVVRNDSMPFIVVTRDIETEVLGTSFNIRSYGNGENTDISLVSGKVKVNRMHKGDKASTLLSPGEQLRYHNSSGKATIENFDVERVTAWKDGILLFKDAGFEEFIDQLERWYGVDFQIYGTPAKDWKVNGRYEDEKLDDILVGLKFVYDIDYKIHGDNISIKFN